MARGDDGERAAGGFEAVAEVLRQSRRGPGLWRALQTLPLLNQTRGIDCPGWAWPEESPAAAVEFCENGAKALAHEATRKRLDRAFFAEYSLQQLRERSDGWLEAQGRLVEPLWKPADSEHYRALSWEQAFARIAAVLRALPEADRTRSRSTRSRSTRSRSTRSRSTRSRSTRSRSMRSRSGPAVTWTYKMIT